MKLVFLGTSGMVPTKERNVQGIYLDYKGEGILLDCGEGTQRQIQYAGLSAQKIKVILISHWHGDHVAGLTGLLQTIGNFSFNDEKVLKMYGPVGTKKYMEHLMQSCIFDIKINLEITELDCNELETFHEAEEYKLQAINLEHGVPCLGYKFVRKEKRRINVNKSEKLGVAGPLVGELQDGKDIEVDGKVIRSDDVSTIIDTRSVSFIFDTSLCDACYTLAENSDLLVSEAVYKHDLVEKAIQYHHMTAHQAAQVASQAGAKELILTHFSQRYKDVGELEEEAKIIFDKVSCAYDLMKVELDF